jgi:hypothetical protein
MPVLSCGKHVYMRHLGESGTSEKDTHFVNDNKGSYRICYSDFKSYTDVLHMLRWAQQRELDCRNVSNLFTVVFCQMRYLANTDGNRQCAAWTGRKKGGSAECERGGA